MNPRRKKTSATHSHKSNTHSAMQRTKEIQVKTLSQMLNGTGISADPSLRGSAPRSLVCVCLVPDHTPAGVRVFRKRSFSTCCATFRHFFYLLFRMAWVRIWMLFECFGSASPRALEAGDSSFLVRSVGDVSAVFRAAVSHGLGTYSLGINPAAVPLFRKRFSKSFLFRMVWASILLAFLRVP